MVVDRHDAEAVVNDDGLAVAFKGVAEHDLSVMGGVNGRAFDVGDVSAGMSAAWNAVVRSICAKRGGECAFRRPGERAFKVGFSGNYLEFFADDVGFFAKLASVFCDGFFRAREFDVTTSEIGVFNGEFEGLAYFVAVRIHEADFALVELWVEVAGNADEAEIIIFLFGEGVCKDGEAVFSEGDGALRDGERTLDVDAHGSALFDACDREGGFKGGVNREEA